MSAQRVKDVDVHGTATYFLSGNIAPALAEQEAIRRAQANALAEKFGTNITHSTQDYTHADDQGVHSDFQTVSLSEVRGRWIRDTKGPIITRGIDDATGQFWIKAEVWGRGRELVNDQVEMEAKILANSTDDRHATTSFNEGDRVRISFQTATDGYIAIYCVDRATKTAQLVIPFPLDNPNSDRPLEVRARQRYLLLNTEDQETLAVCSQPEVEYNQYYIIFSTQRFGLPINEADESSSKALNWEEVSDLTGGKPGEFNRLDALPEAKFQNWLVKHRAADEHFQFKTIDVSIKERH